jgi:uncharacterized protein YdeI (YjbR/CyaY-like superfamily)
VSDEPDRVHPETAEEWRGWLAQNHTRDGGVWVVYWKQSSGRSRLSYEETVMEALAYGWVDSKANKVDDDRSMVWYSPRRPRSVWSGPNKERVARLQAESRMMPAGQRQVDLAQATGTWSLLDDVEKLVVPDDLAAALAELPGATAQWEAFSPSVRRLFLGWIVLAKRPQTRANRVRETAERIARGERTIQ